MSQEQRALFSCLEFIQQLKENKNPIIKDHESLQIALDCLQEASGLSLTNDEHKKSYGGVDLLSLFSKSSESTPDFGKFVELLKSKGFFDNVKEGTPEYENRMKAAKQKFDAKYGTSTEETKEITEEAKKQAEELKVQGNQLLQQEKFEEAIQKYTEAIKLNPKNAIYYANRAAASTNLKRYQDAVDDCIKATQVDPKYAKAWYRMGSAYAALKKNKEAIEAFTKGRAAAAAVNDKGMMDSCDEQLAQLREPKSSSSSQKPAFDFGNMMNMFQNMGGPGGMDFASLMQNPQIQQMAQQMMQNPDMLNNLLGSLGGMGGGSNPLGNLGSMFGDPSSSPLNKDIKQLIKDPKFDHLRNDPELQPVFRDVEVEGEAALFRHMNNPNIMKKLGDLASTFLGSK